MNNKVVVHYANGKIAKGETGDFFPNKPTFHLRLEQGGEMTQVDINDLKAVYFVESFEGNSATKERIDIERPGFGKKIRVQFKDGEVQYGFTQGYSPDRPGFFVSPCDPASNNQRIFVVAAATMRVNFAPE